MTTSCVQDCMDTWHKAVDQTIIYVIMVHASWHRLSLDQWAAHGVTPRHALVKFKKSGTELFVVDGEGIKLKGSDELFAETWGHWMGRMNERRQKEILRRGGKLVNKRGENLKTAMFVSFDSGRSFHMLGNVLLCIPFLRNNGTPLHGAKNLSRTFSRAAS